MLDKFAIARALREIGMLLELEGENPFKVRAYERGARAVEELSEDLGTLVRENRLVEVPGIGDAISKKVASLVGTGRSGLLDQLRAKHPPGVLELLQVPELGPKKVAALREALAVSSVDELEAACRAGRVRELKGFGARTEQKILDGIARLRSRASSRRTLLAEAVEVGERILAHLDGSPACLRRDLAGSARRGSETVGDLDVVAASTDPAALSEHLVRFPEVAEVPARGETKTTVRLGSGLPVDLRIVPPGDYPTLLHHLTGSKAHHVKLRGIAREKGFTLSEWGLFRLPPDPPPVGAGDGPPPGAEKLPVESEEAIYAALGMQPVPPELREDQGEVEAALQGRLPADLVTLDDVRGMVHCHTTWSDGRASVEEMARAAEALGMEYLTVTDHSRSAGYAGGLDLDRLRRQWDEIDRVQEKVKIRLLKGSEADILDSGGLDWPDEVLERLEVVVASIHSRMKMGEDEMTRRLVRAMEAPVFKIWGHPVGRLLGEREPYALRAEEVLDALARSRGALEVNGDPKRLDADPRMLRMAGARGIPVVLSVDAHSVKDLGSLRWAVATARRGWVRRGDVLNARPAAAFRQAVRPVG
ncbi:MAG TPA: DNA polymerase/3'-5' exonuclease PolX [Anaeromyxobacteraceae bacterium]|nr:DNA polymerase/3'-5' exonuclease PolX [Anaeromyxobacteraceae bacterium]